MTIIAAKVTGLFALLLGTAAILLIPFVAMQFTGEVNWTTSDFVIAAVLLAATGMLFELATAKLHTRKSRLIAIAVIGFCFLFVWADQGHGWGFRYFHSAWLALPLLATAFLYSSKTQPPAADAER